MSSDCSRPSSLGKRPTLNVHAVLHCPLDRERKPLSVAAAEETGNLAPICGVLFVRSTSCVAVGKEVCDLKPQHIRCPMNQRS